MSRKILVLLISFFYCTSISAEISSKFILDSKVKGKEFISIAVTPLSSKKQIKELKIDVEDNKNFLRVLGKGSKTRLVPVGRYAKNAIEDWIIEL